MNILVVDDEELILMDIIDKLKTINPEFKIRGFLNPMEALLEVKNEFEPQIAFLDIEMFGIDGLSLAKELKELYKDINIIFVTGFSSYAVDAFSIHASGYVTKPVRIELLKGEINNLRIPIQNKNSRIKIKTFGNFEVFVNGQILKFGRSKSKEILAYLVDLKGTSCTNPELAGILWEDKAYTRSIQNQLQVLLSELLKTLRNVNAEEIVIRERNSLAINNEAFDCDLYRLLDGEPDVVMEFTGKYMSNYSWSEVTLGMLYKNYFL